MREFKDLKIAVAGTGYVGLSIATLLSQHHQVVAVDIVPEKVELINNKKSPIQDDYIEKYLAEKELNLVATLDAEAAYKNALAEAEKIYLSLQRLAPKIIDESGSCQQTVINLGEALKSTHIRVKQ